MHSSFPTSTVPHLVLSFGLCTGQSHVQVGDGVRSFYSGKDASVFGAIGLLGVYNLEVHFEGTSTLVTPYLDSNLISSNISIMPC